MCCIAPRRCDATTSGIVTLRVAVVSSVRRRPRPIRPPHTLHRLWEGREGDRGWGNRSLRSSCDDDYRCRRRRVSQLPRRIIHRILRAVCCTGSSDISESGGEAEGCKIRWNEGFRHRLQLHTPISSPTIWEINRLKARGHRREERSRVLRRPLLP